MNRKNLIPALAALMIISFAAAAYAGWGGGPGRGGCPGWGNGPQAQVQNLTPEQKEKFDVLRIAHLNKVTPLRKDIYAKQLMLESLMVEPEVNSAKIKTLAKELGELRARLLEERVSFRTGLAELGIENYGGRGMGRGMGRGFGPCGGYGPGSGQGRGNGPAGGAGYGNCPGGYCG